jgi:hypothetical protein
MFKRAAILRRTISCMHQICLLFPDIKTECLSAAAAATIAVNGVAGHGAQPAPGLSRFERESLEYFQEEQHD